MWRYQRSDTLTIDAWANRLDWSLWDYRKIKEVTEARKPELVTCANESYPSIVKRGGGVREISTENLWGASMPIFHLIFSGMSKMRWGEYHQLDFGRSCGSYQRMVP